jgi:hypothetical protein
MEKSQGDVGFLFFSLVVVARVYEKKCAYIIHDEQQV